jgi:hypothetical protein
MESERFQINDQRLTISDLLVAKVPEFPIWIEGLKD